MIKTTALLEFRVYLHGEHIDTVLYKPNDLPQDVRLDLIENDGYDKNIIVVKQPVSRG